MAYNPDSLLKQYFPENKYVPRIYQTHRDMKKIKYEHYILTEMGKMNKSSYPL